MEEKITPVLVKTYGGDSDSPVPPFSLSEIKRYAGIRKDMESSDILSDHSDIEQVMAECLAETEGKFSYRVCYSVCDVKHLPDGRLDLGFTVTDSASLIKHLENCDKAVIFGATIGLDLDRLIARYSRISPVKSLFFQAIGAERIEALCDCFNEEVRIAAEEKGRNLVFRFSPGYGDLPLGMQKELFAVLDCPRKIGLTLNESLIMSPSKSVTAIIGVTKEGI